MPIVTTQRKKQRNLIIVMGAVVFITVVVLYLGVFREGGGGIGGVIDTGISDSLTVPRGFVLDTSILQDVRFRQLVPYTKIQRAIETGRDNPFVPYDAPRPVQLILQSIQEVATTTNATSTNATSTEE